MDAFGDGKQTRYYRYHSFGMPAPMSAGKPASALGTLRSYKIVTGLNKKQR